MKDYSKVLVKKQTQVSIGDWERLKRHAEILTEREGRKCTPSALMRVALRQYLDKVEGTRNVDRL